MRAADLPVVSFSRSTFKASKDGVYVFTGTTSTLTVTADSSPGNWGDDQANFIIIKNRGSGSLTVATAGVNFYDTASVATLTVAAGGLVQLVADGTFWCVVAKA
jgi:hypothetical protein